MREEVPMDLIPNEYRNRPGAEVPLDMLPDGVSAVPAKKNKPTELPFEAEHPTLYALGRTVMDMIPGGKYAYEEERKAFLKLPQREQTRQLLKDTAEAELMLAVPKVIEGVGGIVGGITERFAPKAYKFFTKPLGKVKTEPTIKPTEEPIKHSEVKSKPDLAEPTISGKEVPSELIPDELSLAEPSIKPEIPQSIESNKGIPSDVARFEGIQSVKERFPEVPDQMVWTDAKTGSTFQTPMLEGNELQTAVRDNTARMRKKFAEAEITEIAKPPELEPVIKEAKVSPFKETPNLSIERVEAKKRPDGVWQLFYRGTRNEVFEGEKFSSATEARNYFKVQKIKAQEPPKPITPELEPVLGEAPKPKPTVKEPWEMTKGEYFNKNYSQEIKKSLESIKIEEQSSISGKKQYVYYLEDNKSDFAYKNKKEALDAAQKHAKSLYSKEASDNLHIYEIGKALSEGKTVPPEVLKDYPDLVKTAKPLPPELEPLAGEASLKDKIGTMNDLGLKIVDDIDKGIIKLETIPKDIQDKIYGVADGLTEEMITRNIEGRTSIESILKNSPEKLEKMVDDTIKDLTDFYNQAKAGKPVGKGEPEELAKEAKTISQFTEEYKGGMGEAGYISIGGKEIVPTPKVVTTGTKDIALPEFGLTALHIADRHPFLKPIIEANIKALQNTNDWILRYSDRIAVALNKVEKTSIWEQVFGRKGTTISDLDLMIEGKKATPSHLAGFTAEIKGILVDIKGEIIQKMKNDFAKSLSPKQKEYLDWIQNGKTGAKPKYTSNDTIKAVDEAFNQFKEMEKWGIQDYFPHIFKGKYKYLNEDGGIIASGQTAKQAKANFEEFIESHPETKDKTFMFVSDFYDLMTVRKILNPELVNPLEYLGTRLSRKEFFSLINKTEKVIKEEIASAGILNTPKVKVDMSGIASFQKGNKFSGHFMRRKTSLSGEETDPFKAMMSYVFSVGRKLGLEDAKKASYAFSDSLPLNMPNAKSYIKMQADNMAGRYNLIDKIFDETIGEKLGMKPFVVSRFTTKAMGLESKAKLGFAPAKTAINRIGGTFHTVLQEGVKNYIEGKRLLIKKDPFLMNRIETEGHLAGMEQLFANEGIVGISKTDTHLWRPLGAYQRSEIKNRSEALASGYSAGLKKFNGDKDAAWIYAIDSARLTQGLYDIASKPVIVRGPVLQAGYQFKQYLNNEIRFMSQITPKQWAGYIPGMVALSGTRGALLTIKSIVGISLVGMGIDNLMERLNRKAPHLHRGIFGLAGFDVSAPASWQIPSSVKDWIGVFPRDLIETGNMAIKGLKNNGWTDEEINDYVRQIVPVGYNVFKGFQMLTEGVQKEGTKTIYRGDKSEGVINLLGAKTVKQSQASDSTRYMNQQRRELLEKIKVAEDKIFSAKGQKNTEQAFNDFMELKNPQTSQEINDIIEGLRQSAKSRMITEEQRVFLTLPKRLKREEIRRRD